METIFNLARRMIVFETTSERKGKALYTKTQQDILRQRVSSLFIVYFTWFVGWLVITGVIAFLHFRSSVGFNIQYGGTAIPWDWSISEFAAWAGEADMGHYAKMALHLIREGRFEEWTINLWPPGFPFLISLIIRLTGEAYYPVKMLVLSVVVWAAAFTVVYTLLKSIGYRILGIALTPLPMYFDAFREWSFGYGVFYSDGLSLPFFISGVTLLVQWFRTRNPPFLFWSAALLAILCYLRAYFEMLVMLFGVVVVAIVVFQSISAVYQRWKGQSELPWDQAIRHTARNLDIVVSKPTRMLILAVILTEVLLLPWRWFNIERGQSAAWIHHDHLYVNYWATDEKAHPIYRESGGNTPCHVALDLCKYLDKAGLQAPSDYNERLVAQRLYKNLTFSTLLSSPVSWYTHRARYLPQLWFGNSIKALVESNLIALVEGVLILLSGIFGLILSARFWWRASEKENGFGFFGFLLVFLAFNVVVFTFLHFEPRYSLSFRIFFLYAPFWAWCSLPRYDSLGKLSRP